MIKKFIELKEGFFKYSPDWVSKNLLKITMYVLISIFAINISWPQLMANLVLSIINITAIPIRNCLMDAQKVNYYAYVNFIALLTIVILAIIIATVYTKGAVSAAQKIKTVLDKEEQIYSMSHQLIDNDIYLICNGNEPQLKTTFNSILNNIIILDLESLKEDFAFVVDTSGHAYMDMQIDNPMEQVVIQILTGLYATGEPVFQRVTKKQNQQYLGE